MDRRNLIETEIIRTKGMIAKLEQLGIDTTGYNNELREIINKKESIENKTDIIMKESESSNYRSGSSIVFKLDKITLNLEKVGYYIEGEKYFQSDLSDYKKDFEYAYFIFVGFILLGFIVGIETFRFCETKHGIINDLKGLFEENGDIANYRYYKRDEKSLLKEKAQLLSNLKTLLLTNDEVIKKFISLYEKNEHFLKAYPEIQEMYENALTVNKTLKLTK